MKLYELSHSFADLETRIADAPDDETLPALLSECRGELQEKFTNIAMLTMNMEAVAVSIKQAEQGMAARRQVIEKRAENIRKYILFNMKAANISKIECAYFTMKVQNNPPGCVIDDAAKIPMEYLRQPIIPDPAPDKRLMLEDMKQGVIIEGTHMETTQRLVIK